MKKLMVVTLSVLFALLFSTATFAEQEGKRFLVTNDIEVYCEIGPGAEKLAIEKNERFDLEEDIEFGIFRMIHYNDKFYYIKKQDLTDSCYELINVYSEVFANMTDEEEDLLLKVLYLEGHNMDLEGHIRNLEVILNRVLSSEWPDTVYGVISQKGQFVTWKKAKSGVLVEGQTYLPYGDECVSFDKEREALNYCKKEGNTYGTDYIFFATFKCNGRDFYYHNGHYYSK